MLPKSRVELLVLENLKLSQEFCRFLPSQLSLEEAAKQIQAIIQTALLEDLGSGDISSEAVVPAESESQAHLLLKEAATIAGLEIFELVLRCLCPELKFKTLCSEGASFGSQETPARLAEFSGNSRALLSAERTALNLIQRLSGIASAARAMAYLAQPFGIEILDTRKTTPGLRLLEKWAVKAGGAANHRFGLFDMILIKDNHRLIAGGVKQAVEAARAKKPGFIIEVEVNTHEELLEALELKVERVMLDNMSPDQIKKAVEYRNRICKETYLEVSGGVNPENIGSYLISGINGISMGALTHSVKSIDISLEFEVLNHD